jgi:hypothetical protein
MRPGKRTLLAVLLAVAPARAHAEADQGRFGAGGYFRVMTRPDFQGGDGRLGYWNLYGRLMNEGPWAALEMKLDLLKQQPRSDQPWTSLHAKIEGGSVANGSVTRGTLQSFALTQLYVQAGNVGLRDVTWQIGTLDYYFGDLGLYDMRPAELFFDTLGVSGKWTSRNLDVLVGGGDSGYFVRGPQYDTIFTGGGMVRARLGSHLELGGGGQYNYEPKVVGNKFAPYSSPDVAYVDFVRKDAVKQYSLANPGQLGPDSFRPKGSAADSWKVVGYVGFGRMGPILWNSLFVNFLKRHPDNFYVETPVAKDLQPGDQAEAGEPFTIYVKNLTDQRYQLNIGDEMHLTVIPERLDAAIAGFYGNYVDLDNQVAPSDDDQTFYSTVIRLQLYLSQTVHLIGETSIARELSHNGNRYRDHRDSIFQNDNGVSNSEGLEFGDDAIRDTWQGKAGVVLNPTGYGLFTRPSLRFLYGLQYSSQNDAFGNSFVESLDQYNFFGEKEQHLHQVVGVEAEAWF